MSHMEKVRAGIVRSISAMSDLDHVSPTQIAIFAHDTIARVLDAERKDAQEAERMKQETVEDVRADACLDEYDYESKRHLVPTHPTVLEAMCNDIIDRTEQAAKREYEGLTRCGDCECYNPENHSCVIVKNTSLAPTDFCSWGSPKEASNE